MRKTFTILFCLAMFSASSQSPVSVMESSLKVNAMGGEQVFYLGFAEGDEMIFSYQETSGKELKEVEIMEYPSAVVFTEYRSKRIDKKKIYVSKTGIYKFRFYNSSIAGKVVKINIQRIPASEATRRFNTTVYWKTLYDTTYHTVQENYVEKSDTAAVQFYSQVVKLSPKTNPPGKNRAVVDLELPQNTIAWAYYLGVGMEGMEAHYTARENFMTTVACNSKMPGYNAMAALAAENKNVFQQSGGREFVKYWFIKDQNNAMMFQQDMPFIQIKRGNVTAEAGRMQQPLKGRVYLGFENDNPGMLDVLVKATAIVVNEQLNTRTVEKMNVKSRKEPFLKN